MDSNNKYQDALKKYATKVSDKDIAEKTAKIIAEKFEENNNKEVYRKLYSLIDLTTLNTTDSKESVWKFTETVNDFEGSRPDMQNVAAICVFPNFAETVK
jgi:deoxyribose-phosphate aldolase